MTSSTIYCTHVTFYSGNKLPPFYIGSSSVAKVQSGYHGSVRSKKWKEIYYSELKLNPHLFSTEIIAKFNTRQEATDYEYEIQIANNAVKSYWFFNESIASKNGFFGRDVSGKLNPGFGKNYGPATDEFKYSTKNTIWMHKDNSNYRIKIENINESISNGFIIGYANGTTNLNRKGIKFKNKWSGKIKLLIMAKKPKKFLEKIQYRKVGLLVE